MAKEVIGSAMNQQRESQAHQLLSFIQVVVKQVIRNTPRVRSLCLATYMPASCSKAYRCQAHFFFSGGGGGAYAVTLTS